MSRSATVQTLRQARRTIKTLMAWYPEGMASAVDRGRQEIRRTLEEFMNYKVRSFLENQESQARQDRRNGFYRRRLLTRLGEIELQVPRTRHFSAVGVVQAYARRAQDVDAAILACFVLGLSTRKVVEALQPIFGIRLSPSTISRVAKGLDEAVAEFHRRPLQNKFCGLLFDGVVLSRKSGMGAMKRPVLVALGIRADGKKEIIDFLISRSEGKDAWEGFLNDLFKRGLTGEGLEIITIDGCPGLASALEVVYPRVPIQRCWAHKVRNITDKVRKADQEAVKRGLRRVYNAPSRLEACHEAIRFGATWEKKYPAAVRCLMRDLEELLAFFSFEDPDWRRAVRTTNAIERRFREVRRRTRPMGVFTDRTSMDRIMFAIFTHLNQGAGAATPFLVTQNT